MGSGRGAHEQENPRRPYATGLRTQPALVVRGSSRRITIMRLESANIRVINRRHSYLDRDPCRFPRAGIKPKPRSVLTGRSISGTGQITAVERSVTEGEECADILMLLATIRGGVNSLMAEILEDHIQLHLMHPNRAQQTPEELTEDLIGLVRAYLK